MKKEFLRFQLKNLRFLVGTLEILGGVGIIVGFYYSRGLILLASLGLFLLMLGGVLTRIQAKDSFGQALPALFFMIINIVIFLVAL